MSLWGWMMRCVIMASNYSLYGIAHTIEGVFLDCKPNTLNWTLAQKRYEKLVVR